MNADAMRVLLIEDNPADARLVRELLLEAAPASTLQHAERFADGLSWLATATVDVVLLDLDLPDGSGPALVDQLRAAAPDTAIVVLSGNEDAAVATTSVQRGAQDYLLKDRLDPDGLARAIRHARERTRQAAALRTSEQRLQTVIANAPIVLTAMDADGVVTFSSGRGLSAIGRAQQSTVGLRALDIVADVPAAQDYVRRVLAGEACTGIIHMRGVVLETHYEPLFDEAGKVSGAIAVSTDVTERWHATEALRQSESHFRALIESAPIGACILDEHGHFESVNDAYAALFGYDRDELIGRHIGMLFPPAAEEVVLALVAPRPDGAGGSQREYEMITSQGQRCSVLSSSMLLLGHDGHPRRAMFLQDLTTQKQIEQHLAHAAHHDPLTGLPNRALFQDRLEQALRHADRGGTPLSVLLIDLDGFKAINDTLGHAAGDALLRAVAMRLGGAVRASDTVARLGGDEFAVLLLEADEAGAIRVANKIRAALRAPVPLRDAAGQVGGSIGIAVYPDHAPDAEALVRKADSAMYAAKRAGGGYVVYAPEQQDQLSTSAALAADLRQALAACGLHLHYQPVVTCLGDRIERVEALARWRHPVHGYVPPDRFIPLAERTGLIASLTVWALDEALRQCSAWRRQGLALGVAVNLSMLALHEPQFLDLITALLRRHAVPPDQLTLEITESALMAQPEQALGMLTALDRLGVRLSIDDFGTGHSSISQLRRLPVKEFKLDRGFLSDLEAEKNATLLSFLIGLGIALGTTVVVEGVETREVWDLLHALGCSAVQGYYVSRPQPAEGLERWLRTSAWRVERLVDGGAVACAVG